MVNQVQNCTKYGRSNQSERKENVALKTQSLLWFGIIPFQMGQTPLYVAVSNDHEEMCTLLLEARANTEAKTNASIFYSKIMWNILYSLYSTENIFVRNMKFIRFNGF